jgi:hypothetical protein
MATESGFSNSKKQGRSNHKTIHDLGSSRFGGHVVPKSVADRFTVAKAITGVEVSKDQTKIKITCAAHGALLVQDLARFITGSLLGAELEIIQIIDVDNFVIRNVVGVPSIGDTFKVVYYITPKADAEGNVNFSPGPTTYSYNTVTTVVAEDTGNPANNRSLPSLVNFYKNGVQVPVKEDTVTPANSDPLPVKLTGVTGDVIINAGDLSVAVEATNDSVAIGDAVTGETANVRQNSVTNLWELKVADDEAHTLLGDIETAVSALDTSLLATEATLIDVKDAVEAIELVDFATEATLSTLATEATADAIKDAVQLLDNVVNVDGNPSGTSGLLIGGIDSNGDFQAAAVNPAGELSVSFSSAGFATETTLAALNNKHNADYGASSGAIRTAAQLGNATGSADFNAGVDGAQTLRVSANLKRAGNELSYNSGAADANTPRVVLATRHESNNTPVATRLANGSNWITDTAISGAQKTISGGSNHALETVSLAMGWDGSSHREIKVDSTGKIETVVAPKTPSFSEILNLTNSEQTLTAPAGAKWCKIYAPTTNGTTIRFKLGGTATVSSGMQLQPGRSEDFDCAGNISVIAEDAVANQHVNVIWGV